MTLPDVHKTPELDYLVLLLILALAFYIAYVSHLNYPYPLHVDERLNRYTHPARSLAAFKQYQVYTIDLNSYNAHT